MYLEFVEEMGLVPSSFNVGFDTSGIQDLLNEFVMLDEVSISGFISRAKKTIVDLFNRFVATLKKLAEKVREKFGKKRALSLEELAERLKDGGTITITTNKIVSPKAVVERIIQSTDGLIDIYTSIDPSNGDSPDEIVDKLKTGFYKKIDPEIIKANGGKKDTLPNFFFSLNTDNSVSLNHDDVINFINEMKESDTYFENLNTSSSKIKQMIADSEKKIENQDPDDADSINAIKAEIALTSTYLQYILKMRTDAVNTIAGSVNLIENALKNVK